MNPNLQNYPPTRFRDKDGQIAFPVGEIKDFDGVVDGVPRYAILLTNLEATTSTNRLELLSATGKVLQVILPMETKIYTVSTKVGVRGAATNSGAINGIVAEIEVDSGLMQPVGGGDPAAAAAAAAPAGAPSGGSGGSGGYSGGGYSTGGGRVTQPQ